MSEHSHPSYFKIYVMLLVLFVISVAGPEFAEIFGLEGPIRLIVVLVTAFGIALVKAYYVLAYFMHLKFEKIYAPYILVSMVAIMLVFFFGTATDVMKAKGHHWEKTYQESDMHHGDAHHGEGDAHGESEAGHEEPVH